MQSANSAASALNTVDGNRVPELILLLVASFIEVFAALLNQFFSLYAVLVGAISFVLCLLFLFLEVYAHACLDRPMCRPGGRAVSSGLVLSLLLTGWWLAGAGVCTFYAPFTATSNGYFACWAGVYASVMLVGECWPAKEEAPPVAEDGTPPPPRGSEIWLTALMLCALAVMLAAIAELNGSSSYLTLEGGDWLGEYGSGIAGSADGGEAGGGEADGGGAEGAGGPRWETLLMIALSSITLAFALLLMCVAKKCATHTSAGVRVLPLMALILVLLMWLAVVALGTFRHPFVITGKTDERHSPQRSRAHMAHTRAPLASTHARPRAACADGKPAPLSSPPQATATSVRGSASPRWSWPRFTTCQKVRRRGCSTYRRRCAPSCTTGATAATRRPRPARRPPPRRAAAVVAAHLISRAPPPAARRRPASPRPRGRQEGRSRGSETGGCYRSSTPSASGRSGRGKRRRRRPGRGVRSIAP